MSRANSKSPPRVLPMMIQVGTLWSPSFLISKMICGWNKTSLSWRVHQNVIWLSWDEGEMRTEAAVRATLNKGLGGEHGYVAVTYDSRAEMAPYLTLFSAQLFSERNSEISSASKPANRWQHRLAQHSWVLQDVLQVLSVPQPHAVTWKPLAIRC